jgi:pyridoxal phosphate enzyme (YggS family)
MSDVAANLSEIRSRITAACMKAGRDPSSVGLIAVSKTFPVEMVREAAEAGQRVFGESRLQEAESKIDVLPSSLQWHFIGRVQRNKVRKILPRFDVIHAIDSTRLALYTDEVARELGLFPKVFLQVNIGGEESKGGFKPDVIRDEIDGLLGLERLEVLGLMCIPPPGPDADASRPWFQALRKLRDELQQHAGVPLPCLSMGMSDDFEVAIEEGATHVRVGSSIFGKRAYRVDGELG